MAHGRMRCDVSNYPEHWNDAQVNLSEDLRVMEEILDYEMATDVADYAREWQRRLFEIATRHQPFDEAGIQWCHVCGTSWPCETLNLAGAAPLP